MFNLDDISSECNEEYNLKWSYVPDHPYRMLVIGSSGSGKTNALLNLIKEQDSDNLTDKIYLYAKDFNQPKYQFIIKNREGAEIKHLNDPKVFIEYSAYMNDAYNNINDSNPTKKRKRLIVFDDMIADIMNNRKFQAIVKKLFIKYKEIKYISCIYHSNLFFCSKRS